MLSIIMEIRDEQDRIFVENLYLTHEKQLYLTAKDILKSHEDAQDCVHETIVQVIKYLDKYRDATSVYSRNM